MNDERCDRDRATAILTLADEGLHYDVCKSVGTSYPCTCDAWRDIPWLASVALEALDTIDKARTMHKYAQKWGGVCEECESRWPCPTWQALNGGNE